MFQIARNGPSESVTTDEQLCLSGNDVNSLSIFQASKENKVNIFSGYVLPQRIMVSTEKCLLEDNQVKK